MTACANPGGSGDDDGGDASSSGEFAVTVDSAALYPSLGGIKPASGNVFAKIALTLSNTSVPTPLAMVQTSFSLETDASLVVMASVLSATLEPRCREDLSVAAGGTASCTLAFEVPVQQTAAALLYDDLRDHTSRAPVSSVETSPCTTQSLWQPADPAGCGECIQSACPTEQQAYADANECASDKACYSACGNTCECADKCFVTPTCYQIVNAIGTCVLSSCSMACE